MRKCKKMKEINRKYFHSMEEINSWYHKNEDKIANIISIHEGENFGSFVVFYFEYKVDIIKS